jgi:hypothetical protein
LGMGRGNSPLRAVRLGAFVLVILAGVVFHHSGGVYQTIHVLYLVLIVGVLAFALLTRTRRGKQSPSGTAGGSWGGLGGSAAAPTSPPSTERPFGLINNEHDLGPDEPRPDSPTG